MDLLLEENETTPRIVPNMQPTDSSTTESTIWITTLEFDKEITLKFDTQTGLKTMSRDEPVPNRSTTLMLVFLKESPSNLKEHNTALSFKYFMSLLCNRSFKKHLHWVETVLQKENPLPCTMTSCINRFVNV
jgi:hypothetical protein